MKFTARDVSIDSGSFVIADPEILGHELVGSESVENPYYPYIKMRRHEPLYIEYKVPNGIYKVKWDLLNGPLKEHTGRGTLKVISGKIWVVDPMYVTDDWDHMKSRRGTVLVDKTGGDGAFDVEFTLTRK